MLFLLQEAEHAGGGGALDLPGPFRIEPGLIFWTWVIFITLFLLLRKFAWPQIVKLTEEREKTIQRQLAEAEKANQDAQAALEEHRQLLAGAKEEAQSLVNEAKVTAQKERELLLEKAKQEQREMLERAKREIKSEQDRAVQQLRREAVDLSLRAASRLIEQNLDDNANRKIVEEYLGSLGNGK